MVSLVDLHPFSTPLHLDHLTKRIKEEIRDKGSALIVVAEGVSLPGGDVLTQAGKKGGSSADFVFGGVGAWIARYIRQRLHVHVRYENLGLLPRCCSRTATGRDRDEARELGASGGKAVLQGESGHMVGLVGPTPDGEDLTVTSIPLRAVAGIERPLPAHFQDLGPAFQSWLRPLLDWDQFASYHRLFRER
ncbi:hypothetical protein [Alicyclobacillus dauci]|uniref:Phosphofructokinase domain-containing protein n=1 Tax=Alicyclobacillus dauci TaxID=1475485 RepID=A0ABY6Z6H8_9BACL|nr:hypothetical protein [Alicyclobacillus dauci]WAH38379.1 hypothetical protein NZD86_07845 [Alicyclobacillus dauci]